MRFGAQTHGSGVTMRGKFLLVVGLGAGYVLGSRAGRKRYDQICRVARALWRNPRVQRSVTQAESFAKDRAPEVLEFLSDGARKVVSQVSGKPARGASTRTSAAKREPRKPGSRTSASRTAASKPGSGR